MDYTIAMLKSLGVEEIFGDVPLEQINAVIAELAQQEIVDRAFASLIGRGESIDDTQAILDEIIKLCSIEDSPPSEAESEAFVLKVVNKILAQD